MITSTQTATAPRSLSRNAGYDDASTHQFVPSLGSPEADLWGEVLLRAIEDFKTYMAYRKDPKANPLSAKMVRSIVADGCDPEYWIFAQQTGFDAVCMVLNVEPDCIRRFLRSWLKETLEMEPSY
jgi:hypothetical protein